MIVTGQIAFAFSYPATCMVPAQCMLYLTEMTMCFATTQ